VEFAGLCLEESLRDVVVSGMSLHCRLVLGLDCAQEFFNIVVQMVEADMISIQLLI
jgi:hypothetical protein